MSTALSLGSSPPSGEVRELRRAPALPHVPHAPGILQVVVAHRLQRQRLGLARPEVVPVAATRRAQRVLHPLALPRPRERQPVVVRVEAPGLRQEVVRVHRAHVGGEVVALRRIRSDARQRARLVTRGPVPQRVREVGELRQLAGREGAHLHPRGLGEGHRQQRGELLPIHVQRLARGEDAQPRRRGGLGRQARLLPGQLPELPVLVELAHPALARGIGARRGRAVGAGAPGVLPHFLRRILLLVTDGLPGGGGQGQQQHRGHEELAHHLPSSSERTPGKQSGWRKKVCSKAEIGSCPLSRAWA